MKRQVTALLLTASLLVQSMTWAEQLGTPSDLPTEELLDGLRYAMYREKGLGSSAFLYEVQMDAAGSVVFRVTVGSDVWEISQDDTALLYYREIYNGPADVLAREQ